MKTSPSNTLRFLKMTAIGGVLFLLPIVVVIVLLGYVLKAVVSVHGVLKEWIPFDSAIGIALLFGLAVILIFAACFVAGLFAHRAIGAHFSRTIESQLMKVYPKYGIYKDLLAGKFGGDRERSFTLPSASQERTNASIPRFKPIGWRTASSSFIFRARRTPGMVRWRWLARTGCRPWMYPFAALIDIYERLGRDSSSQLNAAVGGNGSSTYPTEDCLMFDR